ncbi:uncharacterized protein EDB93DRAFT_1306083 [Suillus bovinus]|uniref:uncharacterized protein n=1 Tax=Suillus bovinus TaxID=48563 RepID=UPI001B87F392|nr:uncharacterized protein EDB93DRAFT_1306083 [Suillus bovinus]KAG2134404.1 hypothetical protein EDB93DRAFT_1306083 [Suillus bovinus]
MSNDSLQSPVDVVDVDEETICGEVDVDRSDSKPHLKFRILHLLPWLSIGSLIVTSAFSFTLWVNMPVAHLAVYSPARVAVEPTAIRFVGTIEATSIYRIDGGPLEIPTIMALLPQKSMPLGPGFLTMCHPPGLRLTTYNFLRKAAWPDHYKLIDPWFQRDPSLVRMHLDDCIELIRQSIMCHAEAAIITWDWVKNHIKPYPNFNTRHACRKFENVLDWAVQHGDRSEVTRMEDTIDLPLPHQHNI